MKIPVKTKIGIKTTNNITAIIPKTPIIASKPSIYSINIFTPPIFNYNRQPSKKKDPNEVLDILH